MTRRVGVEIAKGRTWQGTNHGVRHCKEGRGGEWTWTEEVGERRRWGQGSKGENAGDTSFYSGVHQGLGRTSVPGGGEILSGTRLRTTNVSSPEANVIPRSLLPPLHPAGSTSSPITAHT